MHIHIACICLAFIHCAFSYVSSICLSVRMQSHIGYGSGIENISGSGRVSVGYRCSLLPSLGGARIHSLIITREGFHWFYIFNLMKTNENQRVLMKTNENQQIPMIERFAFDGIRICVFGYFVSAYFCIFVRDSYLYFICVYHIKSSYFSFTTMLLRSCF